GNRRSLICRKNLLPGTEINPALPADYFPAAGLGLSDYPQQEGDEPYTAKGRVKNFSVDASAGIVFYF
ncbi:MAG: hypothetical protein J5891_05610, partial [Spirochaetales bacterium]|nr:hypothetical protein [Spirochaetales bacterium]